MPKNRNCVSVLNSGSSIQPKWVMEVGFDLFKDIRLWTRQKYRGNEKKFRNNIFRKINNT